MWSPRSLDLFARVVEVRMAGSRYRLYQVIGRKAPTEKDASPPAYRMKIFARNEVMAKSRFWYFMHQMRRMKVTTGEILDVNEIYEEDTKTIKNFGIWIKYMSRSGTHNMYREYRDTTLTGAVSTMYNDMAGRHRVRSKSIQIIKTCTVADEDVRRTTTQMMLDQSKFPLPHRQLRPADKQFRTTFASFKARTHFN